MPRTIEQRTADVRARLHDEVNLWVASASAAGEAYLITLTFCWDGTRLTVGTARASRTARNLLRAGFTRVALPSTGDVVILEGPVVAVAPDEIDSTLAESFALRAGFDPRIQQDEHVDFQMTPQRILAWREPSELVGRVVMRDGLWLVEGG